MDLRRFVTATIACLGAALAAAPAALAVPVSVPSTGAGNVPVGSGGGASGRVTVNDLWGLHRTTLDFPASRHRAFEANATDDGGVLHGDALELVPDASRHTAPGTTGKYRGDVKGRYSPWAWDALEDIGVFNTCPVTVKGGKWNASAPAGCWFSSPTDTRIREIHPTAPGGSAAMEGGTSAMLVRVWRSPRADRDSTGKVTGYAGRSTAEATPILERITAENDDPSRFGDGNGSWNNSTYFNVLRPTDEGHARNTDSDAYSAPRAGRRRVAGPLYGSCRGEQCSFDGGYISGEYSRWVRKPASQRYIQDLCDSGALARARWSDWELAAEVKYRASHDRNGNYRGEGRGQAPYASRKDAILDWIDTPRAQRSPLPPGFKTTTDSLDQMCRDLSEHLALDWSIGQKSGSGGAQASVTGNLVPGRVYTIQSVFIDSRENVVKQTVNMVASSSTKAGKPAELPVATGEPVSGTLSSTFPRGAFGGGYTDQTATAPVVFGSTAALSCPPGNRTDQRCPVNAETEFDEVRSLDPSNYSMWTPRALAFSVFNRQDADKHNTYGQTHRAAVTGFDGAFEMGAGRGGSFPLAFGSDSQASEAKAALASRPVWGARIPLFSTATGTRSDVKMAVQFATYAPRRGSGVGGGTAEPSVASLVKAADTRFFTLLGEDRYQYANWTVGKAAETKRVEQRLTMDWCPPRAQRWSPSNPNGVVVPDLDVGSGPRRGTCDPEAAIPGTGWKVSDAYQLPATTTGAPDEDLVALFTQERTGSATLRAAFNAPGLSNWVRRIEVWDADNYEARQSGEQPDYVVASPGRDTIRFCDTDTITCLSTKAVSHAGHPTDELPSGEYVVRFVLAGGHPATSYGITAWTYTNVGQRWAVRFDLRQQQGFVHAYRARATG